MIVTIIFGLTILVGLALAIWKKKRKLGLGLVLVPLLLLIPRGYGRIFLYEVDRTIGWRSEVLVTSDDYTVELIHYPGDDFYTTYFRVTRADGKVAEEFIDLDDERWFFPREKREGETSFFVRGLGAIKDKTPYYDRNRKILSGYSEWPVRISKLEFYAP